MSDFTPNSPNVGDCNLLEAIKASPQDALALITAHRMESTLSWVSAYERVAADNVALSVKHSKLLVALQTHEMAIKHLREANK